MADSAVYIELASNNGDFFTNALLDDVMIRPQYATQKVLIGTSNGNLPTITITSNTLGVLTTTPVYPLDVAGDINLTGTLRQNGAPYIGSQWSNNSSNVFLLTSNVGIGKSNPAFKLDVSGDINFTGALNQNGVPYIGSQWSNNSTNVFLLNSNVGIRTSNPSYPLDVVGDINFTGIFRQNGVPYIGSQWSNNSTNIFVFGSNIGVGTSNPVEDITVIGGKIYSDTQYLGSTNDSSNVPSFSFREESNTGLYHACNATLGFVAGGVEALRVTPGDLRVNQTLYCGSNLNVASNIIANGNLTMNNRLLIGKLTVNRKVGGDANVTKTSILGFSNALDGIILDLGSNTPQSNQALRVTWSNATEVARITGNGNVGIGTSNPTYKLDVFGTTNIGQKTSFYGASTYRNIILTPQTGENRCEISFEPLAEATGSNTYRGYVYQDSNGMTLGTATGGNSLFVGSNNRVGVATTSPAYTLDVAGSVRAQNLIYTNNQLNNCVISLFKTGNNPTTTDTAYYGFGINNSLLRYQVGATTNDHGFFADTTELMRIKGTGNIGIGTNAPTERLQVSGKIYSDTQILNNSNDSASVPSFSFKENSNTGMFHPANNAIGLTTGGTERLRVDSSGNVGIGTMIPSNALDVVGNHKTTGYILSALSNTNITTALAAYTDTTLGFGRLTASSSSTTTGLGRISWFGFNRSTPAASISVDTNNGWDDIGFIRFATSSGGSGNLSTKMTLASDGNLGIGTTTPSYKLDVNGISRMLVTGGASTTFVPAFYLWSDPSYAVFYWRNSNLGLDVSNPGNNLGSNKRHLIFNEYADATSGFVGIGTGTPLYKLHVAGTIYATGDVIAYSDRRLKSNITIIDNALTKLHKLNGYTFNLPNDEKTHTGLIAQEILEVLPEAVYKEDKEDGQYSVAYGNIAGLFVEAIKELDNKYKKENETLREEIAQLRQLLEIRTST